MENAVIWALNDIRCSNTYSIFQPTQVNNTLVGYLVSIDFIK